jgi:hypothetical protein
MLQACLVFWCFSFYSLSVITAEFAFCNRNSHWVLRENNSLYPCCFHNSLKTSKAVHVYFIPSLGWRKLGQVASLSGNVINAQFIYRLIYPHSLKWRGDIFSIHVHACSSCTRRNESTLLNLKHHIVNSLSFRNSRSTNYELNYVQVGF